MIKVRRLFKCESERDPSLKFIQQTAGPAHSLWKLLVEHLLWAWPVRLAGEGGERGRAELGLRQAGQYSWQREQQTAGLAFASPTPYMSPWHRAVECGEMLYIKLWTSKGGTHHVGHYFMAPCVQAFSPPPELRAEFPSVFTLFLPSCTVARKHQPLFRGPDNLMFIPSPSLAWKPLQGRLGVFLINVVFQGARKNEHYRVRRRVDWCWFRGSQASESQLLFWSSFPSPTSCPSPILAMLSWGSFSAKWSSFLYSKLLRLCEILI